MLWKKHVDDKQFKCDKSFTVKYSILFHEQAPTGAKALICDICENSFSCLKYQKNHFRYHTCDKPI